MSSFTADLSFGCVAMPGAQLAEEMPEPAPAALAHRVSLPSSRYSIAHSHADREHLDMPHGRSWLGSCSLRWPPLLGRPWQGTRLKLPPKEPLRRLQQVRQQRLLLLLTPPPRRLRQHCYRYCLKAISLTINGGEGTNFLSSLVARCPQPVDGEAFSAIALAHFRLLRLARGISCRKGSSTHQNGP